MERSEAPPLETLRKRRLCGCVRLSIVADRSSSPIDTSVLDTLRLTFIPDELNAVLISLASPSRKPSILSAGGVRAYRTNRKRKRRYLEFNAS
jgi:hypothetical protein